ncbi:aspartyl-phosphate phosphatase Spo0E family protein [Psychrobacillus psychrodurans]|uniref:aspartyl-phosphate phosphatase Spo0E family protein n=1 Tax=Psychrobacillus psychrodurans TaxID=126157 RepID=UPI0008E849B9|nr:aspartyl-phosphate phosphatase Spo0E family protein [Psychrobacillus psychrodurans]MCZ8539657.1 aspartyl-phosphate phosphatase Spo0E family protein [Psychrobacillus psychrodurans]SFM43878.1 stage 0 sporulation regulatory protein [Psychrobacillus psychrodurans]
MKSLVSKKKLEFIIEIKRKVMCKKAIFLGFTHPEVVKCSQELDVLLNIRK